MFHIFTHTLTIITLTRTHVCHQVIYVQSLVGVLMMGKLMRKVWKRVSFDTFKYESAITPILNVCLAPIWQIFFGTLRPAEFEHLMERFWYALTETCLAFTVFRDDFNPKFVALFTVLLFLKSFHWLAEERVDYVCTVPLCLQFDFIFASFHI